MSETYEDLGGTVVDDWDKQTQLEKAHRVIEYLNKLSRSKFTARNPKQEPTSHAKIVIDRIKDGYTKENFQSVIRDRAEQWRHDDKMRAYLRPSTLFRKSNFENYLAQIGNDRGPVSAAGEVPEPDDVLTAYLQGVLDRGGSWGYNMPPTARAAAIWWRKDMQHDCEPDEIARKVRMRYKDKEIYQFPYIQRLKHNLRMYMSLPRGDQALICGGVEDGITWRGEGIELYKLVCEEMGVLKEMGREAYKNRYHKLASGVNFDGSDNRQQAAIEQENREKIIAQASGAESAEEWAWDDSLPQ